MHVKLMFTFMNIFLLKASLQPKKASLPPKQKHVPTLSLSHNVQDKHILLSHNPAGWCGNSWVRLYKYPLFQSLSPAVYHNPFHIKTRNCIYSKCFCRHRWNRKDTCVCVCRFDSGKDGFIDLMELKLMMEKLGAPQTHLGLKNMIREVDEDYDGKLSFREVCTGFD